MTSKKLLWQVGTVTKLVRLSRVSRLPKWAYFDLNCLGACNTLRKFSEASIRYNELSKDTSNLKKWNWQVMNMILEMCEQKMVGSCLHKRSCCYFVFPDTTFSSFWFQVKLELLIWRLANMTHSSRKFHWFWESCHVSTEFSNFHILDGYIYQSLQGAATSETNLKCPLHSLKYPCPLDVFHTYEPYSKNITMSSS